MEFLGALLIVLASVAQLPLFVGLIKPTWIRLQSRKQVFKWWVISFVSFAVGGAFLPLPDPAKPLAAVAAVEQQVQVQAPAPIIPDQNKVEAEKLKADAALAKAETEKLKAELEQAKLATEQANAAAELAKQQADAAELARVAAEEAKAEQARADAEKLQQQTAAEQAQAAADQAKQQAAAVDVTPVVAPLALLSAAPTPAPAEKSAESPPETPACKLAGKVVSVADGDTITVLDADKKQHKIRMAGIDAPEKAQPFGNASKKYLSDMVAQKEVCIDWNKEDKYQRKVGKVLLDGEDVDLKMVTAGLAWHYKKYQDEQLPADRDSYAAAHDKAKSDTIGLWSEPGPIEPGEWRGGARPQKAAAKVMQDKVEAAVPTAKLTDTGGGMSCGSKRYCGDMDSCAEACFYLNQCNIRRLDGDHDGRPCEKLCSRAC